MIAYHNKQYIVRKDGTQYYRVYEGHKRIASFLLLSQAIRYIDDLVEGKASYLK